MAGRAVVEVVVRVSTFVNRAVVDRAVVDRAVVVV